LVSAQRLIIFILLEASFDGFFTPVLSIYINFMLIFCQHRSILSIFLHHLIKISYDKAIDV
jgi:hypothetical protein